MSTMFPMLSTLVDLIFKFGESVGHRLSYLSKERPSQLVWIASLLMIFLGTCFQAIAVLNGWSPSLYQLWLLFVVVLPIAFLGQGIIYLIMPRKPAHIVLGLLITVSIVVMIVTLRARFGFVQLLPATSQSQIGVPGSLRNVAAWFAAFGIVVGVGGAVLSLARFALNGGDRLRVLAVILAAAAILCQNFSNRTAPLGTAMLYRLMSTAALIAAAILIGRVFDTAPLSPEMLVKRRFRVKAIVIGVSAAGILSAVALLPVVPIYMGIANARFKSVYIQQVPTDNNGVYLVTNQGVLQVYSWSIEPEDYPGDSAVLNTTDIQHIVVVSKQFDVAANYRLYSLSTGEVIPWQSYEKNGTQLTLNPGLLEAGQYELQTPTDNMFGGDTWQYFTLQ
ncbi:MAG: hypothetical protein ACM3PY_17800 [Omnitrophica WOR_2 bacterium]